MEILVLVYLAALAVSIGLIIAVFQINARVGRIEKGINELVKVQRRASGITETDVARAKQSATDKFLFGDKNR